MDTLHSNVSVHYQYTDIAIITFEIKVTTGNRKSQIIQHLAKTGRYKITASYQHKHIQLIMSDLQKEITINNTPFNEEVQLKINVPRYMKVKQYKVKQKQPLASK